MTSMPGEPAADRDPVLARHEDGAGGWVEILEVGDEATPCRFLMQQTPGVGPPAAEYHPHQRESFRVVEGTLDLGVVDGTHVVLQKGETYQLPAGVPHLPRAGNGEPVTYEATLTPGMQMPSVFEALFRYERERSGLGKVLRIALTLDRYRDSMRLVQPLRTILWVMAAVAKVIRIRP